MTLIYKKLIISDGIQKIQIYVIKKPTLNIKMNKKEKNRKTNYHATSN